MSDEIRAPKGFLFAAVHAGIRKTPAPDLGLIVSDRPASAAAVFTTNRVVAAPVVLSRKHLAAGRGRARVIVANAGNANCATPNADRVALRTAEAAARLAGTSRPQVLIASTGVIGMPLDEERIPRALPSVFQRLAPEGFGEFACAIMTTDTRPKIAFREARGGGSRRAVVLGMAKGAGMIHPRMATMLGFVVTDAAVTPARLRTLTKQAAGRTFNRISVDGDTSTNDTVFVMANGAAGAVPEGRLAAAIEGVMAELAVAIVRDGEGARKLVRIDVTGARSESDAERIARAVANSPLVKTAIAGGDPNWGRILSAAGNSGARFDPSQVSISVNRTVVCRRGMAADFDETGLATELAAATDIHVRLVAGKGKGSASFWTCDLTEGYILINASYRT